MKTTLALMIFLMIFGCHNTNLTEKSNSENQKTFEPNESPENVMQTIFNAAKTGELGVLQFLLPPYGQGDTDNDVERLCNLGREGDSISIEQFKEEFKNAKIVGIPMVSGNEAEVDFVFGHKLERSETMKMQKVGEKWYLMSF